VATPNTAIEAAPVRESPRLESGGLRESPRLESDGLKDIGLDFIKRDGVSQRLSSRLENKLDALLHSCLTAEDVARKLEVDPACVEAWLASEHRTLYGIQAPSGWRVPAFQLTDDGLLPGIEQVIPRLHPDLHPVAFAQWFQNSNPDLVEAEGVALSPREWLRRGHRPACVATLAARLDCPG